MHCGIQFVDVDRHGFAGVGCFVQQVAQQSFANTLAATLRQQRDVDDAMLGRPAFDIEAADVADLERDDQPVGVGIMRLMKCSELGDKRF